MLPSLLTIMLIFSVQLVYGQYCTLKNTTSSCTTYEMYIGSVEISQNGNAIYSKSNDKCTGSSDYSLLSSSSQFSLTAGGTYSIEIESGPTYRTHIGMWIDLNGDADFDDANEFLSGSWSDMSARTKTKYTFSVPCTGVKTGITRMRLRTDYEFSGTFTSGSSCKAANYGEAEDYTITLNYPSKLSAGFYMPDTAYVKTPVVMRNKNQTGYFYHGWDVEDDGSIEYTTVNAQHYFTIPGRYCVKLYSGNCLGMDSATNCIQIVNPTAPPVADFVAESNKVEIYEMISLKDLSTNGAIFWEWFLFQGHGKDSADSRIDYKDQPVLRGGGEESKNPGIYANNFPGSPGVGKWSVGLIASNNVGASYEVVKYDYVEVTKSCDVEMGPGTITSIPGNVIVCAKGTMMSKSDGSGNYTTNESGLDAMIAPCGAESITFTFDKWKVKTGVNLKIYDGQDATGTPLHPNNGFTESDPPTGALTSKSGAMYFLWSSGSKTDEGFLGHWTSQLGSQNPPVASFKSPDTSYNAVWTDFVSTSENAIGEVFYTWEIDGAVEANTRNMESIFYSNKTYNVCLTVETCSGKDKACKKVVVAPITSKSKLDFNAEIRRPKVGDEVQFNSIADKANTFQWNFFPDKPVEYVGGTNANSPDPIVSFKEPGKYTVSLTGWNNLSPTDSALSRNQVIKAQYVIVIEYCKPVIGVTTSVDVAINKVRLEDNASARNILIDNSSEVGEYTDYTEEVLPAQLTFGGKYYLTLSRNSNANLMNRKVWIDWNIDGDFNDAGELVLEEKPSRTKEFKGSFIVPDLVKSFEGTTRMRIGVSYKNDLNEPCGASDSPTANRIGEFEDYALVLVNDKTLPVITLIGSDTVYVEVGAVYTDAGAKAFDPTEGDISNRLDTLSTVEYKVPGAYEVTYCVEDASGNKAPCVTRVVYVVIDRTPPVLKLRGDSIVYVDVIDGKYEEKYWDVFDNLDGNLDSAVIKTGEVDVYKIGTYVLTYTVQDAQGNKTIKTRKVIVRDRVSPKIKNDDIDTIDGQYYVYVQIQSVFVDRTMPSDNYNNGTFGPWFDYKIWPSNARGEAEVDTRVKGTTAITYTVTDESGNQTSLVIHYVVEDYIKPEIDLHTSDTVYHRVNEPYAAVEASASDNFYDKTQVSLSRKSNVNPFVLGLYTDVYTATDASGNVAIKKRWVRVVDLEAPTIFSKVGPALELGLYSNVRLSDYLKFQDNYDSPSDLLANLEVLYNGVNFYKEGTYAAEFRTTDNSGNKSNVYTLYVNISRDNIRYTSGVEETNVDAVSVYPNPSAGTFRVALNLTENTAAEVAVFDMLGNKIKTICEDGIPEKEYDVDITGSVAGMYVLRVTTPTQTFHKRILIQ